MADRLNVIDVAQRTAAKVAALAYLIPVAFVVYANFGRSINATSLMWAFFREHQLLDRGCRGPQLMH